MFISKQEALDYHQGTPILILASRSTSMSTIICGTYQRLAPLAIRTSPSRRDSSLGTP